MKQIGEALSTLFDERLMKKARGYSRLFASWSELTEKNGIAAAADHSRIKELDRGILRIEADHPGWIQILQTKEHRLLDELCRRFPGLNISGISLVLSRSRPAAESAEEAAPPSQSSETPPRITPVHHAQSGNSGYDAIKDESLKTALKRLEKSVASRGRSRRSL
jgi:hypothetical protein